MTTAISDRIHRPKKGQFEIGELRYYPILKEGEASIDTSTLVGRVEALGVKIGLEHGRRIVANQKRLPTSIIIAGQSRLLSDFFIVLPGATLLKNGVRSIAILICRKGVWEIITRLVTCRWNDFFLMAYP